MMRRYRLNPQTRLRRTSSGGAAFLPETVTTVELDVEGFTTLSFLWSPRAARDLRRQLMTRFGRNFTVAEVDILLRELAQQQFIIASLGKGDHKGSALKVSELPSQAPSPLVGEGWDGGATVLPAPESVHLQLTNVCNLRCPFCYVGLHPEDVGSLPLERIFRLIDEWAEMGVFQLALGGGEPLMSPKCVPVVCRARQQGIIPNLTTNGWLITEQWIEQIAGSIGEVRVSLHDVVSVHTPQLEEKAMLLREYGVRFGFNLIVTRHNLSRLASLLRWACAQGAATINLIRPKPAPDNARWYTQNALTPGDASRLVARLGELETMFARTVLTVDCAFSFLFDGLSAEELQARGVAGCAMGDRLATVKWNGDVYPCSHLHGEGFKAGNVRWDSFREIWERSERFTRVRRELGHVEGPCGVCGHNAFCKGCRAVMQQQTSNGLEADRGLCHSRPYQSVGADQAESLP
jgi:pyrroloquinoline quinone biosynthesis protein E